MRIDLLGPLRVRGDDGGEVPVAGVRLRRLLAELALVAGRPVSTAGLEAVLWVDGEGGGAGALQSLVSRLRRVLGGPGTVTAGPAGYTLVVDPDDVDVVRFERGCRRGQEFLRSGDAPAAAAELSAALGLWRGPLGELDGSPEVARLAERRLDALADRVEADLACGSLAGLPAELEVLTAAHPYRERFAALRVRVLHAADRSAEALAAFESTRRLLADEFGSDPSPALRAAHLAVLTGSPAPAVPAPRTAAPGRLTSFVGRERDLDRLRGLLGRARCITVVGPGGAGKTRLVTEAVHAVAGRRAHVVALAPVTQGEDVLTAVLAAVGARDTATDRLRVLGAAPEDPFDRLVAAVSATPTVLVLDNCEHLLDDTARLVEDLLRRCPDLVVLTTSREALGVDGEVLHPLAPLRAPEVGAGLAQVLANPAVRLFGDRAVAVVPGFAVDAGNRDLVVDLVRRLDGLPLALELAAARLRTMALPDLHDRLADRFRLLTGGRRTAVARHRTLRAVVDWSWDLLEESEQTLLQRLSVFAAPFSVQAAVALGGTSDPAAVADALDSLTEKSLLHLVPGATATDATRYGVLETIREYAAERLEAAGDLEEVRESRTRWVRHESEAIGAGVRGPDQVRWSRRLDAESEDLLAGLRHLVATGRAEEALEVLLPVALWWVALGRHAVVRDWLAAVAPATAAAGPRTRTGVLATVIDLMNRVMGGQDGWTGDPHVVGRALSAELAAAADDAHPVLVFFIDLFLTSFVADDPAVPAEPPPVVAQGEPFGRALFHLVVAATAENHGDVAEMERRAAAAEEGFRELGESLGLSAALRLRGQGALYAGDLDRAAEAYAEAAHLVSTFGAVDDELHLRMRLVEVLERAGNAERAREERARTAVLAGATSSSTRTWVGLAEASLARRSGRGDLAREVLTRLLDDLPQRVGDPTHAHERVGLGAALAHLDLDEGDPAAAHRVLVETYPVATGTNDMPVVALFGTAVARWALAAGDLPAAARVLGASTALRGAEDPTDPDVATVLAALATVADPAAVSAALAEGRGLDRPAALALLDPRARDGQALRL